MGLPLLPEEANFTPEKKPFINFYAKNEEDRYPKDLFTLVHPDTGVFIANCGKTHKASNFIDRYEPFRTRLEESNLLDLDNVRGAPILYNEGAALQARFRVKHDEIPKILNEPAGLRITYRDSHNQSCRSSIHIEILRLACTNGMIGVAKDCTISSKHTTFDNPHNFSHKLSKLMGNVMYEAELMQKMQGVVVTEDQALNFIENSVASSKKDLERVESIYRHYANLGNTGYRMLQVVTHLSSHPTERQRKSNNKFQTTLNLESKSEKILRSKEFHALCVPA